MRGGPGGTPTPRTPTLPPAHLLLPCQQHGRASWNAACAYCAGLAGGRLGAALVVAREWLSSRFIALQPLTTMQTGAIYARSQDRRPCLLASSHAAAAMGIVATHRSAAKLIRGRLLSASGCVSLTLQQVLVK